MCPRHGRLWTSAKGNAASMCKSHELKIKVSCCIKRSPTRKLSGCAQLSRKVLWELCSRKGRKMRISKSLGLHGLLIEIVLAAVVASGAAAATDKVLLHNNWVLQSSCQLKASGEEISK